MTQTPSLRMHEEALAHILERLDLTEQQAPDGGPWLTLTSHAPMAQGEIGKVRVFSGAPLSQLVTCSIVVPAIGLDSHMLFAFAPSDTAIPHFTVDSVEAGGHFAFHIDLTPRVDLAVNPAYMDAVFTPLTELFKAHQAKDGLSQAQLDPRQLAVMSPWMLVNRADAEAFASTFPTVHSYLDHWLSVLEQGVPAEVAGGLSGEQLAARDAAHRAVIFSPEIDKVWNQIQPLIGEDAVRTLIALLRDTKAQRLP